MIETNNFEKVLDQIMYHFNPCKTEQLIKVLTNSFANVSTQKAYEILYAYELNGNVLLSEDGWAMTKGKYLQVSGDSKEDFIKYDQNVRIPPMENIINRQCDTELKYINCLWVLISFLPESLDFSDMSKPFHLSFMGKIKSKNTNKTVNKLIEVIDIKADYEDIKIEQIKASPQLPDDEEIKKSIRRIAIIENEKHAWKVPERIGFTHVVTIDDSTASHFRVVEDRKKMGKAIW